MTIYKRITDVEVVEKNNNMNVLVEDGGALKKISVSQVGGGNGENVVLTVYIETDANYEVSLCETNMTYAELSEAINSHKVILGTLVKHHLYDDSEYWYPEYSYCNLYSIVPHEEDGREVIETCFGEYFIVYFYSDGTIVGYECGNG